MKTFWTWAISKLKVDKRLIAIYCVVYFLWGMGMDRFGSEVEIARFTYWWQVITCYILYMVPISLLLRGLPFHAQYAYGLVAMGLLEFGGYALETSYAYPDNILDHFFNERNFSLGTWPCSLHCTFLWAIGPLVVYTNGCLVLDR